MRKKIVSVSFVISMLLLFSLFYTGCSSEAEAASPSAGSTSAEGSSATGSRDDNTSSAKNASGSSQADSASSAGSASTSSASGKSGGRTTINEITAPSAPGTVVYGDETASIDASNTADGYICVSYAGDSDNPKAQVVGPDENTYTYNLEKNDTSVFPLTAGNGTYTVSILEHIDGNSYAVILSQDIEVTLEDEFRPFLSSNHYVQYTQGDEVTKLGISISEESTDDLDYVTNIYHYVTENITYDTEKAENLGTIYCPDLEETLSTKKGICFDYASLMTALLRSQGIPTKLVFGYSGTAYHAWISVYLDEIGWVDNVIQFDGKNWELMDPTLAANNREEFVSKYIGDGSNYTVKYCY